MKNRLITTIILIMLLLVSCSTEELVTDISDKGNTTDSNTFDNSRTNMLNKDSADKIADARLEQIIEAINNKDEDSLKLIFSEQALYEAEDLDGRINYLFNFVQGNIESWEVIVHGATGDSINNGSRKRSSMSWYYMNTDKQKYLIFFMEYLIDTDNPENVGVYMLQVIKAEDKETQFEGFGPNTRCAGIYKPKE